MRGMRLVPQAEFDAYVAAYPGGLGQRLVGETMHYVDPGEPWPHNIRASFRQAGARNRRPSGWRIVIEEPATS